MGRAGRSTDRTPQVIGVSKMGGEYPTNYKRAGHGHLGFQRGGSYSEFTERPLTAARQAASANRENLRMQELVRQTAELDRLRGPVREPRPPMPLATKPAWAQADEIARMASNPHWHRALARSRQLALRAAVRVSPLGRILDVLDIFSWGLEFANFEVLSPAGEASAPRWNLAEGGWQTICSTGGPQDYYSQNQGGSCGIRARIYYSTIGKMGSGYRADGTFYQEIKMHQHLSGSGTIEWVSVYDTMVTGRYERNVPAGTTPLPLVLVPGVAGNPALYGPNLDPLFAPYNQTSTGSGRDPFQPPRPPSVYTPFAPRNNRTRFERKAQTHGKGIRAIKKIVNIITESLDVANCLYDALPDPLVGRKPIPPKKVDGKIYYAHGGGIYKLTPPEKPAMRDPFRRTHKKLEMILKNLDEVDLNEAIECAVKNQIEDKVIGSLASAAGPFGGKYGRPIGFTSGPAL
jgi:hypothetical protein